MSSMLSHTKKSCELEGNSVYLRPALLGAFVVLTLFLTYLEVQTVRKTSFRAQYLIGESRFNIVDPIILLSFIFIYGCQEGGVSLDYNPQGYTYFLQPFTFLIVMRAIVGFSRMTGFFIFWTKYQKTITFYWMLSFVASIPTIYLGKG